MHLVRLRPARAAAERNAAERLVLEDIGARDARIVIIAKLQGRPVRPSRSGVPPDAQANSIVRILIDEHAHRLGRIPVHVQVSKRTRRLYADIALILNHDLRAASRFLSQAAGRIAVLVPGDGAIHNPQSVRVGALGLGERQFRARARRPDPDIACRAVNDQS